MDNERIKYVAIDFNFNEDVDDEYEALTELENHLRANGYDYFLSCVPGFEQIEVLLINEEQTGYIDTILEDRNIIYEYE